MHPVVTTGASALGTVSFTIGRLSKETGVNIETIRYYERIGLMAKPRRSESGRRLYNAAASYRLGFIRRARELGFAIGQIRALIGMSDGAGVSSWPFLFRSM